MRNHRHAFLIMAHNNWYTFEKIIQLLDAPWNDFYLHIDIKAKGFDKPRIQSLAKKSKIYFTKRHNITWGNESQIKAEMTLFKAAYKNGPYYYYHFLSGADLPIKSKEHIYDFFEKSDEQFLVCENDYPKYEWRLAKYMNVFRTRLIPQRLQKWLNVVSEIVQYKLGIDRAKELKKKYPILGKERNWCDLRQNAVEALLFAESEIKAFTRFSHCPDEMYKQIILLNSHDKGVGKISNTNIRINYFLEGTDHPTTFTVDDYNELIGAPAHFIYARKFDESVDIKIIDMLFNSIQSASNQI